MSIPKLSPKQPGETVMGLYIDFAHRMLPGETITTATVDCSLVNVIKPNSVEYNGTVVTWGATGGTSGTTAVFTVLATGSMGSVREAEVSMAILSIP